MAEKISVEIGLDGGAEVQRQLEDIGKSGQQAFSEIQTAAEQVNLDSATEQFDNLGSAGQAAFQKVQAAAKSAVAFEQIVQGVSKVEGAFESLGNAATKMAARMTRSLGAIGVLARALGPVGIALGVAGGAFIKFGDDAADALNKLTGEGAKLGLTAQQLDVFQKALGKMGVSPEAATSGLAKMAETFGGDLFNNLERFIAQLERMPDSVQRTQLAMQTLGDSLGAEVIAGLQTGTISAGNFAKAIATITPATQEQIAQARQYQQTLNLLNQAWTELKGAFTPIVTPILGFLTEEIKNLTIDIKNLVLQFKFLQAIAATFTAPLEKQGEAAARAAEAYRQLGTGAQQVAQAVSTSTAGLMQFGQAGTQSTQQFATGLFNVTQGMRQLGQQGVQSGMDITEGMNAATQSTDQVTAAAISAANALRAMGLEAAMWSRAAFGEGVESQMWKKGSTRGFASGGFIGGRGTGTSDSNLAWVSRGEHIMPARAVRQPGVLALLEGLRRSGGNLSRVLDGLGHFALGGLVPQSVPAFAAGGTVGMSNVTIQFPGVQPIGGLRASASAVDELHRAAALAQVRSGGRKPSRYS